MNEFLIGIDVGGTNTKVLIMDTGFAALGELVIPTIPLDSLEAYSWRVIHSIDECFARKGVREKKVKAIGMGLPGIVDFAGNKTVFLPLHRWDGLNPCEIIAGHYDSLSFVDNDANINALGEYYFGRRRGIRNLIFLTVGTGLGGAIICDGKLLRGKGNAAAEVGHMTVFANGGRPCVCGNSGCLEPYCSGTAIARMAMEEAERYPNSLLARLIRENGGKADSRLVDKAAGTGDEAASRIFDTAAEYLGLGVANLMKLFDPEAVFIGGGVSNAGERLLAPLRAAAERKIMHPVQNCPIYAATLGMRSGMYGAAAMAGLNSGLEPDDMRGDSGAKGE